MGKGYNNYMTKKPFHPGSKANIKRTWMAEQRAENEKRKQDELKTQYEKEQDLYNNRALLSTESKDKLELNFMYEAPPGAKRERQKEDDEPEYKFEWQRKYNAPREDYAKGNAEIRDQPFGIPVRNVRCIKCHKWGHINTDRECPLYSHASTSAMPTTSMDPLELMKQMRDDGYHLKQSVLGHRTNPGHSNQQYIPSDESDPEMEFLKTLSSSQKRKLMKKLHKLSKKQKKKNNEEGKNKKSKSKKSYTTDSEDDEKQRKHKKRHREKNMEKNEDSEDDAVVYKKSKSSKEESSHKQSSIKKESKEKVKKLKKESKHKSKKKSKHGQSSSDYDSEKEEKKKSHHKKHSDHSKGTSAEQVSLPVHIKKEPPSPCDSKEHSSKVKRSHLPEDFSQPQKQTSVKIEDAVKSPKSDIQHPVIASSSSAGINQQVSDKTQTKENLPDKTAEKSLIPSSADEEDCTPCNNIQPLKQREYSKSPLHPDLPQGIASEPRCGKSYPKGNHERFRTLHRHRRSPSVKHKYIK